MTVMTLKSYIFKFKASKISTITFEYLFCPSFNLLNLRLVLKANCLYKASNPPVSGPHREWFFKSFFHSVHTLQDQRTMLCAHSRSPSGFSPS